MPRRDKTPSAATQLQELLEEHGRLPGELRAAFAATDNERVLAIRLRMDVLPGHVWATTSRAIQERIDGLEREGAGIEASLPEMIATVDDAERDMRGADERLSAARLELMTATNAQYGIELDLRVAQRELAAHVARVD
ncbi:hypothetical protein BH23CHL7_BH23CHL7_05070 [soil metagenome]